MDNKSTLEAQRLQDGLWHYDEVENIVYRNGLKLPPTTETLNEIKKQEVARQDLQKLLATKETDENLTGKIWAFLEEHTNYLSHDDKNQLIMKMKQLASSNYMSEHNSIYLNYLESSLEQKNMETFDSVLEQFYEFNEPEIQRIATTKNTIKGHQL